MRDQESLLQPLMQFLQIANDDLGHSQIKIVDKEYIKRSSLVMNLIPDKINSQVVSLDEHS